MPSTRSDRRRDGHRSRLIPECAALEARLLLAAIPTPTHVVVVLEENHTASEIIGSSNAPYINSLAATGANFTNAQGLGHPSEPNYLELFSGSNQKVVGDPLLAQNGSPFQTPNLASELIARGLTFGIFSEDLPATGSTVDASANGLYVARHNPYVDWQTTAATNPNALPASGNRTFADFQAIGAGGDYSGLPTVSFVVPNLNNDMHGSPTSATGGALVQAGDTWLQQNIQGYANWAKTHNSLLIVTWDEGDPGVGNSIPLIFSGSMVTPGTDSQSVNHDNTLRTIEDMYGLAYAGASAQATPIPFGVAHVAGDSNGDGVSDVGVYQPNNNFFGLDYLNAQARSIGQNVFNYGFHNDPYAIPISGDFNGDGIADVGVYLPDKDLFALDYLNAAGQSIGQNVFNYGFHTNGVFAIPITGDFNGDGITDVGIYQPNNDFFGLDYINAQAKSIGQNVFNYGFHTGGVSAIPITGDFNGDGITDVGVYQPNNDFFALDYINAKAQSIGQNVFNYGFHTNGVSAVPLTGDFNGDKITDVGIYQPNNDFFGLNYLNAQARSIGQNVFNYGFHTNGVFAEPLPTSVTYQEATGGGTLQAQSVKASELTSPGATTTPSTSTTTPAGTPTSLDTNRSRSASNTTGRVGDRTPRTTALDVALSQILAESRRKHRHHHGA